MPLTDVQLRVDRWSKLVLMASTILLIYSVGLAIFTAQENRPHFREHRMHHFDRENKDGNRMQPDMAESAPRFHRPEHIICRLHHFAILGVATALTGIIASFKNRRGLAMCFLVLVLLLEFSALGALGAISVKGIHECKMQNTREIIALRARQVDVKIGNHHVNAVAISAVDTGKSEVDVQGEQDCAAGVRHASMIGTLIIGVIAVSLACCASHHTSALVQRDLEEFASQQQQPAVIVDMVMMKEQPALVQEAVVVATTEANANCTGSPTLV